MTLYLLYITRINDYYEAQTNHFVEPFHFYIEIINQRLPTLSSHRKPPSWFKPRSPWKLKGRQALRLDREHRKKTEQENRNSTSSQSERENLKTSTVRSDFISGYVFPDPFRREPGGRGEGGRKVDPGQRTVREGQDSSVITDLFAAVCMQSVLQGIPGRDFRSHFAFDTLWRQTVQICVSLSFYSVSSCLFLAPIQLDQLKYFKYYVSRSNIHHQNWISTEIVKLHPLNHFSNVYYISPYWYSL